MRGGGEIKKCLISYEKRLLFPYIVFSIINILLTAIGMALNGENIFKMILKIIRSVIFYPYGAFNE